MKKVDYAKKNIFSNLDAGYIMTIIFLLTGIIFNIYVCQCLLGLRK